MLDKAKTLEGYRLNSLNGEIGKVQDFYFDDTHWAVRYLVADTGNWLPGRQVLLSPYALCAVNHPEQNIAINLTRKQIEDSPSLNSDKPVSQQFEQAYYGYYGWPAYWAGPYAWGPYPNIERDSANWRHPGQHGSQWNPHLRSAHEVCGYYIHAVDGKIGHVEDFIIDDETWTIRYLIIDTRNFWPGRKVLISPQWFERVSWSESTVFSSLSRDVIQQSPKYEEKTLLTRDYEIGLHRHYNRTGYWDDKPSG